MVWAPLLTGLAAADAQRAVNTIAATLAAQAPGVGGASYASGYCGLALFFGYLSATRDDPAAADVARRRLNDGLETLAEGPMTVGLFGGLAGVAWTCHHLRSLGVVELMPGMTDQVDAVIAEAVARGPWRWEYDLVHGLAGLGIYTVDHPDPGYREEVGSLIVARLEELAEPLEGGLAWRTRPKKMRPQRARRFPEGRFDLGVAHGTAGIVGSLSRMCAQGVALERASSLLERSLTFLLASRRAEDDGSAFGGAWSRSGAESCRSAWCYGDPGIAAVLLGVAQHRQRAELGQLALQVARCDSERPLEQCGVVDAGICHGAAGLGHLYNRLFQATREPRFGQASQRWFEHALGLEKPAEGLGGFPAWWPEIEQYRPDSSLLSGAAGVGLALLAATSSVAPDWDRPLLIDLEPQDAPAEM